MKISVESIYNWYRNTLRNPKYRWWVILGSLMYVLSPIDLAPDFLPIAGFIDDGVVLTLLITELYQLALDFAKNRQNVSQSTDEKVSTDTVDVDAMPVE